MYIRTVLISVNAMKLYISGISIMMLLCSDAMCGDGAYADLPPVLQQSCKTLCNKKLCDEISKRMLPTFISEAEQAQEKVAWFSYKDSCSDTDHTPEVKKACAVIKSARKRSDEVEKYVKMLGINNDMPYTEIKASVDYSEREIMGWNYKQKRSNHKQQLELHSTDTEQCPACTLDQNKFFFWWPWGQK